MYSLPINNIANHGLHFFQETIFESVKNNSKRIVAVALIALGCLATLYLAYQCCCASDDGFSVDPYDPPKPTPYSAPVYTAPFSISTLSQFRSAILAIQPQG